MRCPPRRPPVSQKRETTALPSPPYRVWERLELLAEPRTCFREIVLQIRDYRSKSTTTVTVLPRFTKRSRRRCNRYDVLMIETRNLSAVILQFLYTKTPLCLNICLNVKFSRIMHLSALGLRDVKDASIDVAYCTNALPHFDQVERWLYVRDAYRVVRPGERFYIDTIALDTPDGWSMITNNLIQRAQGVHPPSTPRQLQMNSLRITTRLVSPTDALSIAGRL